MHRPVSLYLFTIAESGERKTAADELALQGVTGREKELRVDYARDSIAYENEAAAHRSQREQILRSKQDYETREEKREALENLGLAPSPPLLPMLTCPEPTFEGLTRLLREGSPSIGLFSDEGGQFIGGHGMNEDNRLKTASGLSALWDGAPLKRVRGQDGVIILPTRRLCLHIQAQPLVAVRLFDDPLLADQGLLSRILAIQPDTTAGSRLWRDSTSEVTEWLAVFTQRVLNNLRQPLPLVSGTQNELEPRILRLSEAARKLWIGFADHIERLITPDGPLEQVKGLANKAPEHAARIAGVCTLFTDFSAEVIDEDAIKGGIELTQFYLGETLRIRQIAGAKADLVLGEKLIAWLQKKWREPLVSLPDIYQRGPKPIIDRAIAQRIVDILVEHGWLIAIDGPVQVRGISRQKAWKIVLPAPTTLDD
jgi:hypothetical protein